MIAVQVTAAVLVGLAIKELWVAARGEGDSVGTPARAVTVTSAIEPDVVAFGTPVVATADVVVDTTVVDPGSISLQTDFSPYEVAGSPVVGRHVQGGTAHVTFRYTLRCLREGCEPAGARGIARFESGLVRYRFKGDPGVGRDVVDWPAVIVASRVATADVEAIRWRASETAAAGGDDAGRAESARRPAARSARCSWPAAPCGSAAVSGTCPRQWRRQRRATTGHRSSVRSSWRVQGLRTARRPPTGAARSSWSRVSSTPSGSAISQTKRASSPGPRARRAPTRSRALPDGPRMGCAGR